MYFMNLVYWWSNKNISDLEMLYENFTDNPQNEADIEKLCVSMDSVWWNGERKSVQLEVSGIAMYYLKREIPTHIELVEEREEHYTVRFFYHHEIELFAYVKSWIPNIRILDLDAVGNTGYFHYDTF